MKSSPALLANIRLGSEGLLGTNILQITLYGRSPITDGKLFITLAYENAKLSSYAFLLKNAYPSQTACSRAQGQHLIKNCQEIKCT
jgi:hypothetical protein